MYVQYIIARVGESVYGADGADSVLIPNCGWQLEGMRPQARPGQKWTYFLPLLADYRYVASWYT